MLTVYIRQVSGKGKYQNSRQDPFASIHTKLNNFSDDRGKETEESIVKKLLQRSQSSKPATERRKLAFTRPKEQKEAFNLKQDDEHQQIGDEEAERNFIKMLLKKPKERPEIRRLHKTSGTHSKHSRNRLSERRTHREERHRSRRREKPSLNHITDEKHSKKTTYSRETSSKRKRYEEMPSYQQRTLQKSIATHPLQNQALTQETSLLFAHEDQYQSRSKSFVEEVLNDSRWTCLQKNESWNKSLSSNELNLLILMNQQSMVENYQKLVNEIIFTKQLQQSNREGQGT